MENTYKYPIVNKTDCSSYSNSNQITTLHLDWKVNVDFVTNILSSIAIFDMKVIDENIRFITLDNISLNVKVVKVNNIEVTYEILSDYIYSKQLGDPFIIKLENTQFQLNEIIKVEIQCDTCPNPIAANYLSKEQTFGKKQPFMFTQSCPIYARSLLPCQDTPSVKFTCDCEVITPKGIKGLFSGIEVNKDPIIIDDERVSYKYTQKIPLPIYLFAFACGDIHKKQISKRVNVYCEEYLLEKASKEFEDTEAFIEIAEKYTCIPYMFKTFDILVLPPSFPYGGMENPNLTFVNPSIVVGDKSAVNVVAHELAHSWTGNLVTNINWSNFFVNEGFTVFLERKIIESFYGKELRLIQSNVGLNNLNSAISNIGESHCFTSLQPNLEGVNPDDCFSKVPYEKGYNLLMYIESIIGEDHFRNIFRKYMDEFKQESICFDKGFKKLLISYVNEASSTELDSNIKNQVNNIDWNSWLNMPGYCPNTIDYKSDQIDSVIRYINDLITSGELKDLASIFENYTTELKVIFLQILINKSDQLSKYIIDELDNYFSKSNLNMNSNILFEWYCLNLILKYDKNSSLIEDFIAKSGRIKVIKPIYELLYKNNKEEAERLYKINKPFYHTILRGMIERKLNIK